MNDRYNNISDLINNNNQNILTARIDNQLFHTNIQQTTQTNQNNHDQTKQHANGNKEKRSNKTKTNKSILHYQLNVLPILLKTSLNSFLAVKVVQECIKHMVTFCTLK